MADVQAVSPVGQLSSPGGMGHKSPGPRSPYQQRSPTHYGSRPNSRVSYSGGGRPHSRQHSAGRIPRPPSQPRGSPDGSSGRERPSSVRSLHEKVEMSEFLSPAVKSAVRRWKRFHEEKVRERFKERRENKKQHIQAVKIEKEKLARRIPIDLLALEWMNDNKVTVDARAYLLDKLLPTLILGIEKLLMEVDKRHLAEETEMNPNFNPINYLAQYLMRNNPRYSNFPEASPYIRGLREVTDELKNHVFSFEDNRLAKAKAEARRKREEQTRAEFLRKKERLERSGRLREHYKDWMLEDDEQVPTSIIHSALKNFSEVLDAVPVEMKKGINFKDYLKPLEKEKMEEEEFVEYIRKLVTRMSPKLFNELMGHMSKCATAYRKAAILEARKEVLVELFKNCDHATIGIIDRQRVLGLFKAFYDKQPWVTKRHIRNPRRWPVIELDEVDDESSISEESRISSSRMSGSTLGSRPGSQADAPDRPPSEAAEVKDQGVEGEMDASKQDGEAKDDTEKAVEPTLEAAKEEVPAEDKPASEEVPAGGTEALTTEAERKEEEEAEKNEEAVPTAAVAAHQEKQGEGDKKVAEEDTEAEETTAVAEKKDEAPEESRVANETGVKDEDKPNEPAPVAESHEKGEGVDGVAKDETKTSEEEISEKPEETESSEAPADSSKEVPEVKTEQESTSDIAAVAGAGDGTSTMAVPEDKEEDEKTDKMVDDEKDSAAVDASTELKEGSKSKESESRKENEDDVVEDNMSEVKGTGDEHKKDTEKTEKGEGKEGDAVESMQDTKEEDEDTKEEAEEVPKEGDVKVVISEIKETVEGDVETKNVAPGKVEEGVQGGEGERGDSKESLPQTAATGKGTAVSFHEDAIAVKEKKSLKSPVKTPTMRSESVAASAFDQNTLNGSQFVQLVEVFLGEDPPEEVVLAVIKFLQDGYVETEEEKFNRLQKARREEQLAKRKLMMDQLFDKWDNDGSGFLDLDELHSVMTKFKENMEKKIVTKAKLMLEKDDQDHRLSKPEFKRYLEIVCSLLPGGEDNFDPLVEFLMTSVERSYEERIRGQARKKWLAQIKQTAETSGASMEPVYKVLFNILYKDSEQHGRGKRISANIAMLERNDTAPGRGPTCLRYVASTPDDAHFLVNKIMYRDMKGITFTSVDSGKPIHVPRVQNHGNIMFWNPERSEEFYERKPTDEYDPRRDRHGSFIVIPLKDHRKRVFGTMGIDTLNDPQEKSIFITHEISFFQGVAKAFSGAFQHVDVRRKTLRIAESALAWIHRRSPHVQEISVYIVEPDDKMEDFILRRMLSTDKSGNLIVHDHPTRLERKENLFRDYLFKCVDNSETVTADAYGERHTAFPLRDIEGHCVALVDICIGDLKHLPSHENKEVQRMLKLLQYAHKEVSSESEGRDQKVVLEAEKNSEESRIDIMFDRIMLTDLRETVGKLNLRAFAELKSYKDPPKVIHDILVSVLSLFYQDKAELGELEEYHNCKQYVNPELIKKIEEFDPTALEAVGAVNRIAARLKEVPHGAVAKHGSLPAQHLYNWAFVCLSLLEHTSKMKQNQKLPMTDTPPPGSAMSGGVTEQ